MSYTMIDNGRAIRCDQCGTASYNANDIRQRYCGRCHKYHRDYVSPAFSAPYEGAIQPVDPYALIVATPTHDPAPSADVCRADPYDASPSSSDYGGSSSDCGSSSDSSGGGGD